MALIKSSLKMSDINVIAIKGVGSSDNVSFVTDPDDLIFCVEIGNDPATLNISGGVNVTSEYASITDSYMSGNYAMIKATGTSLTITTRANEQVRCIQIRS